MSRTLPTDAGGARWLGTILAGYVAFLAICAILGVALSDPWHSDRFNLFFAENGLFENLTVFFYVLAAVLVLLMRPVGPQLRAAVAACCLFLAARELDLHLAFTGGSMLRTKYYFSSEYPLPERALAGLFMIFVGLGAVYVLIKGSGPFLAALRRRETPALLVAIGILFLPLSKSLDGRARRWRNLFGIDDLPPWLDPVVPLLEEGMEVLVPLSFVLASVLVLRRPQPRPQ